MPGIFGVVDTSGDGSERLRRELVALARVMAEAMLYDSSYDATVSSCDGTNACVGSVTFKNTGSGQTPRRTESLVAVFAGEAIPKFPVAEGIAVQDIAAEVGGRWSGFVADANTRTCVLFNDRYGRERIFVHRRGSRTFFASEAKAILAAAPDTRAFDPVGLAEFLTCGCTIGSSSLFRDIEVLAPGTLVTFRHGGVQQRRYFQPEDLESLDPVNEGEFLDGFPESLRTSVAQSVGAVPSGIAVSLTGGLDSRMILASLDAPRGSVPCYTFGSMFRTTGDVAIAARIAAECGQPHAVIELGREFLSEARDYLTRSVYIADGYLGLSGAAELYVNQRARSIAPARMTGNWGGELMRGVRAFKCVVPKGHFLEPAVAAQIRHTAASFSAIPRNPISAALFQQIPYQGFGRYAIERSQLTTRSPFLADDVVRWLYKAPETLRASTAAAESVLRRNPSLLTIPTDAGSLGARSSGARKAWRKAVIKAEYLTSHGAPNWMARLSAAMPALLLERRFLGVDKFQHFRYWTRRQLSGLLRDTLGDGPTRELEQWFDMSRVAKMLDDHIGGRANYTDEIDRLMTLAIAHTSLVGGHRKALNSNEQ